MTLLHSDDVLLYLRICSFVCRLRGFQLFVDSSVGYTDFVSVASLEFIAFECLVEKNWISFSQVDLEQITDYSDVESNNMFFKLLEAGVSLQSNFSTKYCVLQRAVHWNIRTGYMKHFVGSLSDYRFNLLTM